MKINKHNKNTHFTKLNRNTQNIQPYILWFKNWNKRIRKNVLKGTTNKSSKLHMIYISSNNGRHPVTTTFTPLHYTSLDFTLLHFIP